MPSTESPLPTYSNAPPISSPLATSSRYTASVLPRPLPRSTPSFPPSRPLRPFASVAHAFTQTPRTFGTQKQNSVAALSPIQLNGTRDNAHKPTKIIEPPKNFKGGFVVLNLTQAEFSRKD